jgi:hypothetical protein
MFIIIFLIGFAQAQHCGDRLNVLCKPVGNFDCTDEAVVPICYEGYPCKKATFMPKSLSMCDLYDGGEAFENPYFSTCLLNGHCHSRRSLWHHLTQVQHLEYCKKLLNISTKEQLIEACEETRGEIASDICCTLDKPYPMCPQFCKEVMHNNLVTICKHDDCCKNCDFNKDTPDRQCLSLSQAKSILHRVVKEQVKAMDEKQCHN